MKWFITSAIILLNLFQATIQEEVRLIDLEPQDAKQIIEQQDTSLKYAPKVESNVPAVRYLGNEPHNVIEDIYLANQYHGQDGLGGYLYGYSVPDIAKTEKKEAGGDLRGAYNYVAGNGQEIKVEYWDDGTGFHQIDNVPKNLPEDLPEVKKAKEDFMRIWQEQAERNSHPVEDPYNSEGQYKEGPLSVQGQLHRQQQFAAQFGSQQPKPAYQGSQTQQNSVYQSNLEKGTQTYNPSYQPYQGRDQQNQGTYQSKQYPAKSSQQVLVVGGTDQGQYQGQGKTDYPGTEGSRAVAGQWYSRDQRYPKPNVGTTQGWGQSNQGQGSGGYGQGASNFGSQGQGSGGYGQGASSYGSQGQGSGGHGQGSSSDGSQGQVSRDFYDLVGQGQATTSNGKGNQGQWGVPASGYQGGQGQYQGQSSQNVNKYAPQPQSSSHGQQTNDYSGQYSQNQNKYASNRGQEDDGEYHEKDEENQGPPKGFFYKFDYPVGIIVSKQGPAHGGGYQQQGNDPKAY